MYLTTTNVLNDHFQLNINIFVFPKLGIIQAASHNLNAKIQKYIKEVPQFMVKLKG